MQRVSILLNQFLLKIFAFAIKTIQCEVDMNTASVWIGTTAEEDGEMIIGLDGDPNIYFHNFSKMSYEQNNSFNLWSKRVKIQNQNYRAMHFNAGSRLMALSDSQLRIIYLFNTWDETIIEVTHLPISEVTGLALVSSHDILYWVDLKFQYIGVMELTQCRWNKLIDSDLDKPYSIAVYIEKRFMFWSDYGNKTKIERSDLAGESRIVIVSSSMVQPRNLVVDKKKDKLFWLDGKLFSCDLDGTLVKSYNLKTFLNDHMSSFSMFKDLIVVCLINGTMVAYKRHKGSMKIYATFNLKNVEEIKFGNIDTIAGVTENPCEGAKRCDHLCLLKSKTDYVCKCSFGFSLDVDGKTCNIVKTINRILIADVDQGTLFHIDPSSGKIAVALSLFPELFRNVAFHITRTKMLLYYTPFQTFKTEIMQYDILSNTKSFLHRTTYTITDLVADKWDNFLYYSDVMGRIHELTIAPLNAKIIFSNPNSSINRIYFDSKTRHLFYIDCNTNSIIEMDTVQKKEIKMQYFGSCISAIAFLKKKKIIYYAIGNQIFKGNVKRKKTIVFHTAKKNITDLAIFDGFLYVLNLNSLYKLNRSSGDEVAVTSPVFTNGKRILILAKTSSDFFITPIRLIAGCLLHNKEKLLHVVQFMVISFGRKLILYL